MQKTLYISIVSHANENDIIENFSHYMKKSGEFNIVISVVDNIGSKKLEEFCKRKGFFYLFDNKQRGYGANHNLNLNFLKPNDDDLFLVINPDIFMEVDRLDEMIYSMVESKADIYNIKSYLDKKSGLIDYPDRYFPGILNFFISLATGKRLHYGTNEEVKSPEWMSGGFMLFKVSSFRKLCGFDEDYFMYCEDIDICYRAKKMGMNIVYDSRFYNIHNSKMASRKPLSKSMFWHIKSAFLFVKKNRFYKPITFAKRKVV